MRWTHVGSLSLAATFACGGTTHGPPAAGGAPTTGGGAQAIGGQGVETMGGQAAGGVGSQSTAGGGQMTSGGATGAQATGSGAQTTGGAGGSVPAIEKVRCSDLKGRPDLLPSPFEPTEVTGNNGTFVDACDADGNVVEYHCPMQEICGGGMDCAPYPTGAAAPLTVTCEAGCADGVCLP